MQSVAISPDGMLLAAACGDGEAPVRLWQLATGKALPWPARHLGTVHTLVFSPDSKTLATVERLGSIYLWDVPTGKELSHLKGKQKAILALAFSPDGKWLLSGGKDETVCLWDRASGKPVHFLAAGPWIARVAFSPDSKTFVSTSATGATLWDTATGKVLRQFQAKSGGYCVAFAPDGRTLGWAGLDRTVRVWDVATGQEVQRLTGHHAGIEALAFAPDGKTIASAGRDQRIRLWDVTTGKERFPSEAHDGIVWSVSFSRDGKMLATGGNDARICLWDVASRKLLRRLEGHAGMISALEFSPDGKVLASASGGPDATVRLWDPATGKELRQFPGDHPAGFRSLTFSPVGTLLAGGSCGQSVHLWNVTTGKTVQVLRSGDSNDYRVCFAPSGTLLAVGRDTSLRAWSLPAGTRLYRFQSKRRHPSAPPFRLMAETWPAWAKRPSRSWNWPPARSVLGYRSSRTCSRSVFPPMANA